MTFDIGSAIRNWRKAHGLDQETLGKLVGLDQAQISRIENNIRPISVPEFFRLCAALDVGEADRMSAFARMFDATGAVGRSMNLLVAIIGECYNLDGDYVGSRGAGKDAVATMLGAHNHHHGWEGPGPIRLALADGVKRIAMETYNLTYEQCYGPLSVKEEVDPAWGLSPRVILQRIGTEMGRSIHPSTWTSLLTRTMMGHAAGVYWRYREPFWGIERLPEPGRTWVTPDVRFASELTDLCRPDHLFEVSVRVLRVIRPDVDRELDPHPSEARIEIPPGIPVMDVRNDGTLTDLQDRVNALGILR